MARRIAHAPLAACKAPKSSRKKQAKMERVQRQMERAALVASANSEPDLFSGLNERRVFCTSEGVEVHVNSLHGPQLSPIQLDQCLSLLTSNMRTMYEDSGWGWDEKSKRDGLLAGDSRILLLSAVPEPADGARNGDDGDDADGWVLVEHPAGEPKTKYVPPSQPFTSSAKELTSPSELTSSASNPGGFLGFVHMQFCIEAEKAVLYVLELQLVEAARNQGLGEPTHARAPSQSARVGIPTSPTC
eukprot:scaffold171233_cov28-Tisochrysis_lutea.AAC.2